MDEADGGAPLVDMPPGKEAQPLGRRQAPWSWVPTLYFGEGLPMITVSVVAALMYKNLGVSNAAIAFHTGLLYLPWSLKPLWAPFTEMYKTKWHWVLAMEFGMAISLGCVALALPLPSFMPITLAFFWMTGFLSSTQDICADGLYISVMTKQQQSRWVGIQGIAWNAGRIMASGVLVTFTAVLQKKMQSWVSAWVVVMLLLAGIMALLGLWHIRVLPKDPPPTSRPTNLTEALATFGDTLVTFFQKKQIWMMIAFVLLYRSGEGFLEKIGPLFMLDQARVGGLGLTNDALGNINGTFGTLGFMVGALAGGAFAAKKGLKNTLFILCLALNIPNVTYIYLSHARPDAFAEIAALVTIEKLGYGFGSVGHMLYMMQQIAPGKYRTAHYAFATSLMGLGLMVPSALSGWVQEVLGYQVFFVFVMIAIIPSFLASWFAPFRESEDHSDEIVA